MIYRINSTGGRSGEAAWTLGRRGAFDGDSGEQPEVPCGFFEQLFEHRAYF